MIQVKNRPSALVEPEVLTKINQKTSIYELVAFYEGVELLIIDEPLSSL